MKIILGLSTVITPLLVTMIGERTFSLFNHPLSVDGTRPVMLGAGLLAALVGLVAFRQMDNRRIEPILSELMAVIRGKSQRSSGLLITVEGDTRLDTSAQSRRLADALRATGREVLLASDPDLDERRLRSLLSSAELAGVRAHALVAAAVRADVVEREVRPALEAGVLVVMERYVDSPLAHFSAVGSVDPAEMEGLVDWATGRLRPDITVLLDSTPVASPSDPLDEGGFAGVKPGNRTIDNVEHHWRVQRLLTEMASADPDRYVVVDADGSEDEVAERVRAGVLPLLAAARAPEVALEPAVERS